MFEFGCAIVAAQIVWGATGAPLRASMAFCAVWLAPTVIFNGAAWGQADSIWTFFTLLSVSLFMQDRNGALPFAMAFAVKAQGVFLATNPSSAFFYLLTATHGLHLLGGVVALGYIDYQAIRLRLGPGKRTAVDVAGIYWHFMGGLWVYLLLLFRLWG